MADNRPSIIDAMLRTAKNPELTTLQRTILRRAARELRATKKRKA
jgi:hypothetical protein